MTIKIHHSIDANQFLEVVRMLEPLVCCAIAHTQKELASIAMATIKILVFYLLWDEYPD